MDGRSTDERNCDGRNLRSSGLLVPRLWIAEQDVHAVAEGDACSGRSVSRGAIPSSSERRRAEAIETGQGALDDDERRLCAARRLPRDDSTG